MSSEGKGPIRRGGYVIDPRAAYNGLVQPTETEWPPRRWYTGSRTVERPPYLDQPPAVVPIDVGRQLFFDDFLVAETDLRRTFHRPEKHPANPILKPETPLELDGGECPHASVFNDGVWFDPADGRFKMWYMAGWMMGTALATSRDGLHWDRPTLDVVPGTNLVLPLGEGRRRDGCVVWLDHDAADPGERFRMFAYFRGEGEAGGGEVYVSPDGVHWHGGVRTGVVGDNTGFFRNPFRKKWVLTLRPAWHLPVRTRYYREAARFEDLWWGKGGFTFWAAADERDEADPEIGIPPELYDVDAVAYESVMLGLFGVFRGPQNRECERRGVAKLLDLTVGFSRDGFHFDRPDRCPFIASERREVWDRAYIHAAGGICLVVGDRLFFYYGARTGRSPRLGPGDRGRHRSALAMYAGAATGLAVLRRDGFASMDAGPGGGTLTTRPVVFSGRFPFVNADAKGGELRMELLTEHGEPVPGVGAADCEPVRDDRTIRRVRFAGAADLAPWSGRPVRLRFHLRNAKLYAFWVSPYESGASGGYVAAGGPGFTGSTDTAGSAAYRAAGAAV